VTRAISIVSALAVLLGLGWWFSANRASSPTTAEPSVADPEFANTPARQLAWIDREGRRTPLAAPPRGYTYPRLSPDGRVVAVDVRDESHGIWLWDLTAQRLEPFATGRASDIAPVWSRDGRWILFSRGRGVAPGLFRRAIDRDQSAAERVPVQSDTLLMPTALSQDGRRSIVTRSAATGFDIDAVDLIDGASVNLLSSSNDELNGDLSPDGRWLAYQVREPEGFVVRVRPASAGNLPSWRVSVAGGTRPVFTKHGEEIVYLTVDGAMWAAPVRISGERVEIGPPLKLFDAAIYADPVGRTYDVTPDGARFLAVLEQEGR
jgi:Tol biopolymer transport system component